MLIKRFFKHPGLFKRLILHITTRVKRFEDRPNLVGDPNWSVRPVDGGRYRSEQATRLIVSFSSVSFNMKELVW